MPGERGRRRLSDGPGIPDGWKAAGLPSGRSRARLENLLLTSRGDLLQLMVLASLMSWTGRPSMVVAMLRRHQRHFAASVSAEHFAVILAEARLRSGDAIADPEVIDLDRLAMLRLEGEADPAGKRDRLVAMARRLHEHSDSEQAFTEALFRLGMLGFVSDVAPFAGPARRIGGDRRRRQVGGSRQGFGR